MVSWKQVHFFSQITDWKQHFLVQTHASTQELTLANVWASWTPTSEITKQSACHFKRWKTLTNSWSLYPQIFTFTCIQRTCFWLDKNFNVGFFLDIVLVTSFKLCIIMSSFLLLLLALGPQFHIRFDLELFEVSGMSEISTANY